MMFAGVAKYLGAKVVTAIVFLAVGMAGYWFYNHPEQIQSLWHVIRGALLWLGFVAVLPWALFFLPSWVVRQESNLASAGLLAGYLALDMILAFYLADWGFEGTLTWGVVLLGFLVATVYNFLICDHLAEQSENTF
jgi:hypothetical protein